MIEIARCLVRRVVATHPDNKVAKRILAFLSSTEDINKLDCIRYIEQDREQFIKMIKKGGAVEL